MHALEACHQTDSTEHCCNGDLPRHIVDSTVDTSCIFILGTPSPTTLSSRSKTASELPQRTGQVDWKSGKKDTFMKLVALDSGSSNGVSEGRKVGGA